MLKIYHLARVIPSAEDKSYPVGDKSAIEVVHPVEVVLSVGDKLTVEVVLSVGNKLTVEVVLSVGNKLTVEVVHPVKDESAVEVVSIST